MSSNLPKLSNRARLALEVLGDGGEFCERLERNSFNGREQFAMRLIKQGQVIKGVGYATKRELESAGIAFRRSHSTSVSAYYAMVRNG